MRILLNPFRRLCKVDQPQVLSITVNEVVNEALSRETNVLLPGRIGPGVRRHYNEYLILWSQDLSSSQASFKFIQVLEVYWRLANLVSHISRRCDTEPKFRELTEVLATGKMARDDGSIEGLQRVWDRVVDLWFEYLDEQQVFQSSTTQLILMSLAA